jgi:uncharacterized membrane protein YedE/YeeE
MSIKLAIAGFAGALFGVGLLLSGMTQPERVLGFLDPFGGWDPTLAFVMGGGLAVYALAWRVARHRRPWFDVRSYVPTRKDIDLPLIAGAAIFGIGWGLAGLCPGPALVGAGGLGDSALPFVAAMLVGMWLARRIDPYLVRARDRLAHP